MLRADVSLDENIAALDIKLSPANLARLSELMPRGAASGERYPEHMMRLLNG